jgi:uncharacterized protein YqjF (DUF2071 family)
VNQRWSLLTFLHWRYAPQTVAPLIPAGLELELFDGAAWVGLVPFLLRVPGLGVFPETNVRTYVRAPGGTTGVWFFSLDAARLLAVVGARTTFGLPYFWSSMQVHQGPGSTIYQSRRHWPSKPAQLSAEVEIGEPIAPGCVTAFDHYLTARFRLYSRLCNHFVFAEVEHPPWPLQRGRLVRLEQNLVEAAHLPSPQGPPIVHYSEGVQVRVGPVRKALL